jgi:excisionase family DNA binding protein
VPELLDLIERVGQSAISELLAVTRPGGIAGDQVTDVEGIAKMLNVSVKTIRRLVDADAIPHMRVGKQLRFSVTDVIASFNRR